jgi:hypothetical protein
MDHRISKDMISSGMIPSGEKNQEDLGKTQYGTVPSPNALSDVYKKMYETKEEVINEHHKRDKDGNTIPHEGEELNEGKMPAGLQTYLDKKKGKKEDKKDVKEDNIDEALPLLIAKGAAMLGKIGAIAGKGAATAAKVTTTGGKVVAGASKGSGTLAKAGNVLNKAADISFKTQMVGNMIPKPSIGAVEKKKSSGGMVSAGADLFDIVKGQLLDEGLSEEEIKDIMLTLTPDEIMSEMAVNPNIAAMDAKNKADMIARAQANKVPDKVKEASKKQMKAGTPREDKSNPYTTQDKKTIIDYNKDK